MSYLPVGWGSHHWDVHDRAGMRWFVTVDELENKRVSGDESVADGFARLRASLRTAVALRTADCEFVVAHCRPGTGSRPSGSVSGSRSPSTPLSTGTAASGVSGPPRSGPGRLAWWPGCTRHR